MRGGESIVQRLLVLLRHPSRAMAWRHRNSPLSAGTSYAANVEVGSRNLAPTMVAPFRTHSCSKQVLAGRCGCNPCCNVRTASLVAWPEQCSLLSAGREL